MNPQVKADILAEVQRAAPPAAVTGATYFGMSPSGWVIALTLTYLVLQIGWLLWRWHRAWSTKDWRPND